VVGWSAAALRQDAVLRGAVQQRFGMAPNAGYCGVPRPSCTSCIPQFLSALQQAVEKVGRRLRRGRKRQVRMGETIFKGHRSYDLMLNLQVRCAMP
jgi:hypothetical protein